jgi:hypothetical protein
MQVNLTPEQESIVIEALSSGHYHDATEVLDDALHVLKAERLTVRRLDVDSERAIERLRNFGKNHGLSLAGSGLAIRDLINEGRR